MDDSWLGQDVNVMAAGEAPFETSYSTIHGGSRPSTPAPESVHANAMTVASNATPTAAPTPRHSLRTLLCSSPGLEEDDCEMPTSPRREVLRGPSATRIRLQPLDSSPVATAALHVCVERPRSHDERVSPRFVLIPPMSPFTDSAKRDDAAIIVLEGSELPSSLREREIQRLTPQRPPSPPLAPRPVVHEGSELPSSLRERVFQHTAPQSPSIDSDAEFGTGTVVLEGSELPSSLREREIQRRALVDETKGCRAAASEHQPWRRAFKEADVLMKVPGIDILLYDTEPIASVGNSEFLVDSFLQWRLYKSNDKNPFSPKLSALGRQWRDFCADPRRSIASIPELRSKHFKTEVGMKIMLHKCSLIESIPCACIGFCPCCTSGSLRFEHRFCSHNAFQQLTEQLLQKINFETIMASLVKDNQQLREQLETETKRVRSY